MYTSVVFHIYDLHLKFPKSPDGSVEHLYFPSIKKKEKNYVPMNNF